MRKLASIFAAGAMALSASFMATQSWAQDKKITVVTWNIPYFVDGFNLWVEEFKKIHPDF